jgi:NADH-quinone oxidoreductase subunit M
MGTYGFLRFAIPFFPAFALSETVGTVMAVLAVSGIVYAALVAMVQPDLKRLVAYSSVSHLGFVMLGIWGSTVESVQGAIMVMISHGLSTGALFFVIGMLYERRHTRMIKDFGGLARVAPRMATAFVITAFSSIGLPGLNGFVGEFLILLGTFRWNPGFASFAALGVILSAVYMLWMFQRVNYGPVSNDENASLPDLTVRERWVIVPTVVMAVFLGVMPGIFLRPMQPSVDRLLQRVSRQTVAERDRSQPAVSANTTGTRLRPGPAASPSRPEALVR